MSKFRHPLFCSRTLKIDKFATSWHDINPNTLLYPNLHSKLMFQRNLLSTLLISCLSPCYTQGCCKLVLPIPKLSPCYTQFCQISFVAITNTKIMLHVLNVLRHGNFFSLGQYSFFWILSHYDLTCHHGLKTH